jgi:hypothetical protein
MSSARKAHDAICEDLCCLQRERRRHFMPALVLAVVGLAGLASLTGIRGDLFDQPAWQLWSQVALWIVCLLVFPAVGLGMLFPSARVRVGLVIGALLLTVVATTGWPVHAHAGDMHEGLDVCVIMVWASGLLLMVLGILSGAFVQRNRVTGVYWVAGGVSLASVSLATWVCPATGLLHIVPFHLGAGVVLLVVAFLLGRLLHRKHHSR